MDEQSKGYLFNAFKMNPEITEIDVGGDLLAPRLPRNVFRHSKKENYPGFDLAASFVLTDPKATSNSKELVIHLAFELRGSTLKRQTPIDCMHKLNSELDVLLPRYFTSDHTAPKGTAGSSNLTCDQVMKKWKLTQKNIGK